MRLRHALATGVIASASTTAMAANPYMRPDESWISISGTVVDPRAETFLLEYDDGMITVEMDDWDSFGEASKLIEGDKVTVYGRIDDDLFELSTIEAGAVYVENLNTHFYDSNAVDEKGALAMTSYWVVDAPVVVSAATLRGTVTGVDSKAAEFTVNTGTKEIRVETEELEYDPLDDKGFQRIDRGDYVSVVGNFNQEFIEGRVFEAASVLTLDDAQS